MTVTIAVAPNDTMQGNSLIYDNACTQNSNKKKNDIKFLN